MSAMHKQHRRRGERAAVGVEAYADEAGLACEDSEMKIGFLIWDLGHLCDREGLDFVDITRIAVSLWKFDQTEPMGIADPPQVTIVIEQAGGSS